MIQLTDAQLQELHKIQVDMLLEVKRICDKCGIKYSLIGGTLLGAIRHQGYIPWDDDADIGMLREDYEKFREVCAQELDHTRYYFQDDRNTKGYRWGYGKLRRKNTLFLRENQKHLDFGQEIFIDIFPLDYAPDSMFLRKIHAFHCFCVRKALWSPVGVRVEKNPLKRLVYREMNKLSKERIYKHYYKYINSGKKTGTVRLNLFPTRKPYGFPISFFEELMDVSFEGHEFPGSKYYDTYLKIKYDDYMKLPPEEKRKVHPVEAIKLVENCVVKIKE